MTRAARRDEHGAVPVTPGSRAWWRQSGPETCPFCLRSYYPEVAGHCCRCDRPICQLCSVYRTGKRLRLCPECAEGGE